MISKRDWTSSRNKWQRIMRILDPANGPIDGDELKLVFYGQCGYCNHCQAEYDRLITTTDIEEFCDLCPLFHRKVCYDTVAPVPYWHLSRKVTDAYQLSERNGRYSLDERFMGLTKQERVAMLKDARKVLDAIMEDDRWSTKEENAKHATPTPRAKDSRR